MEHGSRTRLMTAAVLVVVFGAGIMLGVAADGTLSATTPDEVAAIDEQPEEEARRRRTPMYEQVGPDAEQSALIESIVLEHRERMDVLHDEFRGAYNPRYQALVQDTREAILGVLSPDQAAQYQELLDGWDQRRAERNEKKDRD
jgi:hypothetical protein